jgi:RNA chaperone Hfq
MNPQNNVSHLSAYERNPAPRDQRATLHAPRRITAGGESPAFFGGEPRKKFVAKGHDSQLQDAQHNKHPVEIMTTSEVTLAGTISRRDKYTITLRLSRGTDAGKDLIVYKHAIESVLIDRAAAEAPKSAESEPASAEY